MGRTLAGATPDDLVALGGPRLEPDELKAAVDPRTFVARRSGLGGPAPEAVARLLATTAAELDENERTLERIRSQLRAVREDLSKPQKER